MVVTQLYYICNVGYLSLNSNLLIDIYVTGTTCTGIMPEPNLVSLYCMDLCYSLPLNITI